MAAEWQLSSRGACFGVPPKHSRPGLSRCADRRSPHLVCQTQEIMGRQTSPSLSYPSTDWIFMCHVNSPSRPLFLAASTVHHYVLQHLACPKKSFFYFSALLLFLSFHNTCRSNSPVGLSSHACCAFPGLHCCRTASRTTGLFPSNIVHPTRLFNLQTP